MSDRDMFLEFNAENFPSYHSIFTLHPNSIWFINILDNINTKFVFNILGNDLTYLFSVSQWHLTSS